MKSFLLISVFFLLRVAGCDRDPVLIMPNGKYVGTFIRSTPDARYKPSNVTLTFTGNKFTGASDTANYPALCSGTFKTSGPKMTISNECMFTANFDWSFIFTGDYSYEMSGNKLTITKSYANNVYDQYVLVKQ